MGIVTDSFIIAFADSNGVKLVKHYSPQVPIGSIIDEIYISSEDIFYCRIPDIYESTRNTSQIDGSTIIPAKFFSVGGDFPPLSEKISKENFAGVDFEYMKTDAQVGSNRINITIKWSRK